MPLFDREGLREDVWQLAEEALPTADSIIVELRHLDVALAGLRPGRQLGVAVPNTAKVDALRPYFEDVALVSIAFPSYGDGRGFSLAKLLREEGFKGILRASGPLIADQFSYALFCGFDEIKLPAAMAARQPVAQWLKAEKLISHTYQRGYDSGNILDQRRAARLRQAD
jgi:uncharacterized protein (DUF934 family)